MSGTGVFPRVVKYFQMGVIAKAPTQKYFISEVTPIPQSAPPIVEAREHRVNWTPPELHYRRLLIVYSQDLPFLINARGRAGSLDSRLIVCGYTHLMRVLRTRELPSILIIYTLESIHKFGSYILGGKSYAAGCSTIN